MKFRVIIIGGGVAGLNVAMNLRGHGVDCAVISKGTSISKPDWGPFISDGGILFNSDSVLSGTFDADGRLESILTEKLGTVTADYFVLATGKYCSKGLQVGMTSISEAIFGCDVEYNRDRSKWFVDDFYTQQPFMKFGVKTDRSGHVSIDGKTVSNLYAAGEILCDIDGSDPKSDKAILKSARIAAESILKDAGKDNKR